MAGTDTIDHYVTAPISREDEIREARVRMKLDLAQPLTRDEREFFLHMSADKAVPPSVVLEDASQ